jgi:hypothetical protein
VLLNIYEFIKLVEAKPKPKKRKKNKNSKQKQNKTKNPSSLGYDIAKKQMILLSVLFDGNCCSA